MGDLAADTTVTPTGDHSFVSTLSPDWEIWGPNGGYLASVALRAAGAASARARPASVTAHFVGAGRIDDVVITTSIVRSTRVATSVTATVTQDGSPLLSAIVWCVDGDLDGLVHHTTAIPDVPSDVDSLPSTAELIGDTRGAPHPFWANLDRRPLGWIEDREGRAPSEPEVEVWSSFVPTSRFDDPWVDACRSLILIDLDAWPAATRTHVGDLGHYAPTIELTARFVGETRHEPWLFSRVRTPRAAAGVMVSSAEVWTTDRDLVAVGGSTLLCRPATRRPDR